MLTSIKVKRLLAIVEELRLILQLIMETILSNELYQKTFKHFENFENESGIRREHPILYFGNLKTTLNKNLRL